VRLQLLAPPGHTPKAIGILVDDLQQAPHHPPAVLPGATLCIGEVGRPDLLAAVGSTAEALAGMLYASLHQQLLPWPDETLVAPAHGAGSMCGRHLRTDPVAPLGGSKRYNDALQPMSKADCIRLVSAAQPDAPAYCSSAARLNRRERPTREQALAQALQPLALAAVLRLQKSGAQVWDGRDPADFEGAPLAVIPRLPTVQTAE
jgi:hydroxyacylglutathione hydrolase